MKQTRNQLRAALKNRTLDEFWGAGAMPRLLTKSYSKGELKKMIKKVSLVITCLLVISCLGPWDVFARQPEPIDYSEQEIAQFLSIEAYLSPLDFTPFVRTGEDCPNLAVTVYYNGHFLFEATARANLGSRVVWDFSELPHTFCIAYYPEDVFTVYLVHVPDLDGEQRDTIEIWEVNLLDSFSLFSRHLFTENGSYVVFTLLLTEDKPKLPEEPEEEGEGFYEADEAGTIIKSW